MTVGGRVSAFTVSCLSKFTPSRAPAPYPSQIWWEFLTEWPPSTGYSCSQVVSPSSYHRRRNRQDLSEISFAKGKTVSWKSDRTNCAGSWATFLGSPRAVVKPAGFCRQRPSQFTSAPLSFPVAAVVRPAMGTATTSHTQRDQPESAHLQERVLLKTPEKLQSNERSETHPLLSWHRDSL